ncbi:hypothetical protein TRAPUB_11502 [Trametes pubescens]|uniref:Uncharacterized protein n=1 Tax=Trametes pubescens TaxID=154538 RepID=A0A1M2VWH7_TRAPU|nr:hypothetical protein TRAPUB_11502 [Trametes pubescens]
MPLIISLRFFRDRGLVRIFVTLPRCGTAVDDGFHATEAPSELDCSLSRAITFSLSGGSLMCDASVGSDHSEGDALKMVVEECERIEPKCILRGASDEVRVYTVEEPECVMLEEVLGRGGGLLPSPSSSGAGEKWPATEGRLNFHAVVFGGLADSSGLAARALRWWTAFTVDRLEPLLCAAAAAAVAVAVAALRRNVDVEEAGLRDRSTLDVAGGADGRREAKVRWRLRRGEAEWKMPWEERKDLRGVDGADGVSAREAG